MLEYDHEGALPEEGGRDELDCSFQGVIHGLFLFNKPGLDSEQSISPLKRFVHFDVLWDIARLRGSFTLILWNIDHLQVVRSCEEEYFL